LNPVIWSARAAAFACALLLFLSAPASGVEDDAADATGELLGGEYATGLVERALAADLDERPEWRTLVHYKRGLFGDRSLVDDPEFFASPDGKKDPAAELEATIRSFFGPVPEEGKHPVCRWVARFEWLDSELGFDRDRLPVPVCEPFETILAEVAPRQIVVAFPTAHMNSPASMYGHTLLIIDNVQDSELLSYAVNYAGMTDTTFGPLYAVKGIFGFYEGYYEILPYYAKLQEYNDVNDRDIWEYRLNLDQDEMRRLIAHVYELEGIYSDYYFFDENCSYNLLFLLDVARAGLDLTDDSGLWVIPLDTVRAIESAGLVESVEYRPSKSTKILHIASQLDDAAQHEALAVAAGELDPVVVIEGDAPDQEKILVCDLASEYLQYRYIEKQIPQPEYAARFRGILAARSQLGEASAGALTPPRPGQPETGHRSSRLSAGGGALDRDGFAAFRYRAVYHDLLDNPGGYKRGSEIVFGELNLHYYPDADRLELEQLTLVGIVSLAPRNRFFKPTSWMVDTGFLRRTTSSGERALVYDFAYGLGYSWSHRVPGLWYVMPEIGAQLGGALDGNYSLGIGGSAGILRSLLPRWQAHLFVREIYYGPGESDDVFRAALGQNLELAADWSLRAEIARVSEQDRWWWDWSVRLNLFY
jgi:hypothetical protein